MQVRSTFLCLSLAVSSVLGLYVYLFVPPDDVAMAYT